MEVFTVYYFQSLHRFAPKIRAARTDAIVVRSNGFIKQS